MASASSAASMTSTASTISIASLTSTASIHQKIADPDGWILPGTKMTNNGPFLWNGSSKIQFFTNTYMMPFLSEAVEVSPCYFFEKWLIKLKCPLLLRPLDTTIQKNYWSFYPSEPFTFNRYTMYIKGCMTFDPDHLTLTPSFGFGHSIPESFQPQTVQPWTWGQRFCVWRLGV